MFKVLQKTNKDAVMNEERRCLKLTFPGVSFVSVSVRHSSHIPGWFVVSCGWRALGLRASQSVQRLQLITSHTHILTQT